MWGPVCCGTFRRRRVELFYWPATWNAMWAFGDKALSGSDRVRIHKGENTRFVPENETI